MAKAKAKNVSAGVAPQNKKKAGPVDSKGAYTKVQERTLGKMKMGGKMKKALNGTSLGMKSVKAGQDNNSGVTRADFVAIGKGEARNGKSIKKCRYGCK